ncbi:flagellar motor protein MotD [Cellvibrio sp.]|uniref:flagellar motor protein MotD n=1 Tax=Cellvibrio sp. TaxID=1965322 RepID=UPI00396479C2
MVRRRQQDIHINNERWLVSYADFITLLFAFFVVMYSISQVNESKYRVLSETFVEAFNQPNDSKANPLPQEKLNPSNDAVTPIDMGKTATEDHSQQSPIVIVDDTANPQMNAQSNRTAKTQTSDELTQISDLVNEKFSQLINDQMIKVSSNELWLQIELNDSILFSSGGVETSAQAQVIFTEIANILKNYENPIQVEGFTDNVPIKNTRYPTNWELSSARATEIVKFLATKGVAPERLAAVGYGEFQPVASNDTEAGRAQNRRVAVMVAKRKMDRPKTTANQIP